MPQIGRWRALWMSFYSADVYRASALQWKGIGVRYLLLLLSLAWVPSAMQWAAGLIEFSETNVPGLVAQIPTVTIKDGVMTSEPAGRHEITLPGEDNRPQTVVIVDDSIDEVPSEASSDVLVVARTEAGMIRPTRNERRIWRYTSGDFSLTAAQVEGFLTSLPFWVPPIGYVACVVGSLIFRTAQALLYGLIGQTFARRQDVALEYVAFVRMAAVAITPVVVLQTLLSLVGWALPWYLSWPIAIAIALGYLSFGIFAARNSSTNGLVVRSL